MGLQLQGGRYRTIETGGCQSHLPTVRHQRSQTADGRKRAGLCECRLLIFFRLAATGRYPKRTGKGLAPNRRLPGQGGECRAHRCGLCPNESHGQPVLPRSVHPHAKEGQRRTGRSGSQVEGGNHARRAQRTAVRRPHRAPQRQSGARGLLEYLVRPVPCSHPSQRTAQILQSEKR